MPQKLNSPALICQKMQMHLGFITDAHVHHDSVIAAIECGCISCLQHLLQRGHAVTMHDIDAAFSASDIGYLLAFDHASQLGENTSNYLYDTIHTAFGRALASNDTNVLNAIVAAGCAPSLTVARALDSGARVDTVLSLMENHVIEPDIHDLASAISHNDMYLSICIMNRGVNV